MAIPYDEANVAMVEKGDLIAEKQKQNLGKDYETHDVEKVVTES